MDNRPMHPIPVLKDAVQTIAGSIRQLLHTPNPPVSRVAAQSGSMILSGIADSATSIGGKRLQQDACYHVSLPGAKVVAVADGISGKYRSDYAAQLALLSALGFIQHQILDGVRIDQQVLKGAFDQAHSHVGQLNDALVSSNTNGVGTTMIVAVETPEVVYIGSCGDGAALFAYGEMDWATNYVYPQEKKGGLAEYLGTYSPEVHPSFHIIPKSQYSGGIVLVMTDGMFFKQSVMKDAVRSLQAIRDQVVKTKPGDVVDIHRFLEEWVTGFESDDNRSVGVLISQETIDHWQERNGQAR